ncbi:MAG: hypothetical protein JWN15_3035 [Firmicutes bacterium]|jgi:hypothetical protein|nr:hypothetical protein [Bacillota bacterium]
MEPVHGAIDAGPSAFGASPFAYRNTLRGGVESFTGYEEITRHGAVVYALDHSGGVIR